MERKTFALIVNEQSLALLTQAFPWIGVQEIRGMTVPEKTDIAYVMAILPPAPETDSTVVDVITS